ncbi:HU family DNA-binding protein [Butyricicoccus sp.]|uniref:HU family DNA-binding protein n=1 Tax=Butyricicoccus sp. TaxID=2049021 RepID=UPI003F177DC8
MNKTEFVRATAKRAGTTQETAEAIINAALDVATDAISSGQEIKLQRFGTLQVKQRQTRGRDFQTGKPLPARTMNYAHFEPSDGIKAAINKGAADEIT